MSRGSQGVVPKNSDLYTWPVLPGDPVAEPDFNRMLSSGLVALAGMVHRKASSDLLGGVSSNLGASLFGRPLKAS